jgi:hypothetical protein
MPGLAAGLHEQDLVGADTKTPVAQVAQLRACEVSGRARAVEHDKVVARAVHLGERKPHAADYRAMPCGPVAT